MSFIHSLFSFDFRFIFKFAFFHNNQKKNVPINFIASKWTKEENYQMQKEEEEEGKKSMIFFSPFDISFESRIKSSSIERVSRVRLN